ncbi:hypothetical protein QTH87_22485 [Variovorax sp. J22P168]|uniref:hypothetical protein n=1 Tax=Variovorax jilinensis TaxID=3053513 RepID=UPI002578A12D|nr:hypothetical protein [Variovorax sp. J22P168]MDM0015230.1 hypothetical protein [Variovorax sp. J22P168]
MNGNLTKMVLDVTALWLDGVDRVQREGVARSAMLIVAFGLRAVAGPLGLVWAGDPVLHLPVVMLTAIVVDGRPLGIVGCGAPRFTAIDAA